MQSMRVTDAQKGLDFHLNQSVFHLNLYCLQNVLWRGSSIFRRTTNTAVAGPLTLRKIL